LGEGQRLGRTKPHQAQHGQHGQAAYKQGGPQAECDAAPVRQRTTT